MKMPDIDIDVADKNVILNKLKHTKATSFHPNGFGEQHISGMYFQDIPKDFANNQSTLNRDIASEKGYFKFDILNVSFYNEIKSEEELIRLMNIEPDWSMLMNRKIVEKLIHINRYYELVSKLKPKSIEQLAAVLAIIRPAKKYLARHSWDTIFSEVWEKVEGKYVFSRAHGIAYSTAIIAQMNLLREQLIKKK